MKVSIIIAIYRDVRALQVIMESIKSQTVLPYEIIVAEDGNSVEVAEYIKTVDAGAILLKHTSHEDRGWRKTTSLNNALRVVKGDYVIIVDGDCFMHHKYVESTLLLAEDRTVLCGRRVNLDRTISEALRSGKITPYSFSRNYIYRVFELFRRGTKKIEEGIYIHPPSFFYKCLKYKHKGKAALLGCSWSAPTSLIFEVNGFDEDYNVPTAGEDTDIEMRMRRAGMKFSMVKNAAIVYHLFHATKYDKESNRIAIAILKGRDKNATMCKNGLKKV